MNSRMHPYRIHTAVTTANSNNICHQSSRLKEDVAVKTADSNSLLHVAVSACVLACMQAILMKMPIHSASLNGNESK